MGAKDGGGEENAGETKANSSFKDEPQAYLLRSWFDAALDAGGDESIEAESGRVSRQGEQMTQNGITRRQHYVPDFYLQGWCDDEGRATAHDLQNLNDKKTFKTTPANVLVQSYFYEEDPAKPDNRIEDILAAMEGRAATVVKKVIAATADTYVQAAAANLSRTLTDADVDILAEFAAYQYMRVPGAIEQKRSELEGSLLDEAAKAHHLNPGRFVESGYAYIVDRFKKMKFMFFISSGQDFVTSDWPCSERKANNGLRCRALRFISPSS
ncbi:DUF4238 domain-containing protein [Bradyrhizobium sp. PUT101]|uniref:DUF4238 domain-containing protein n=1 Tax=Bradyrhizobium sp. PUT101 TaxID=3447427 RepID=UPI003F82643E